MKSDPEDEERQTLKSSMDKQGPKYTKHVDEEQTAPTAESKTEQ